MQIAQVEGRERKVVFFTMIVLVSNMVPTWIQEGFAINV